MGLEIETGGLKISQKLQIDRPAEIITVDIPMLLQRSFSTRRTSLNSILIDVEASLLSHSASANGQFEFFVFLDGWHEWDTTKTCCQGIESRRGLIERGRWGHLGRSSLLLGASCSSSLLSSCCTCARSIGALVGQSGSCLPSLTLLWTRGYLFLCQYHEEGDSIIAHTGLLSAEGGAKTSRDPLNTPFAW